MRGCGRGARAFLVVASVVTVASMAVTGQAQAAPMPGAVAAGLIRSAVPAAPSDVYAIGYQGAARVGWFYNDDGELPRISVRIEDNLGSSWTFPAPDSPVLMVTGLANGVSRSFTVRTLNADGWSPASAPSNVVAAHAPFPGGTFSATGPVTATRFGAAGVRLTDGRVLVVGGVSIDPVTWERTPLASAEVYDPATGAWTPTSSLPTGRSDFSLTLLSSGRVLLAGGYDATWAPVSTAYVYNPATGTWQAATAMRSARAGHSATLLPDGTVLVAGGTTRGRTGLVATSSAEIFKPLWLGRIVGSWSATASMPVQRTRHSAVRLPRARTGEVLVVGGNDGSGGLLAAAVFHPSTLTWTTTGSLVQLRTGDDVGAPTVTALANGRVLVAGGYQGGVLSSAELYDPATGTFGLTGPMPFPLQDGHTGTRLNDGRVLVVGGVDDWGGLAVAVLYDPATGTWSRANDLPGDRAGHVAVLLADGSVLVATGQHSLPTYAPDLTAVRYLP